MPPKMEGEEAQRCSLAMQIYFFFKGVGKEGGVSGTCCREHARGWMTGFLPPSSSASGTRPTDPPGPPRIMLHVRDARTHLEGALTAVEGKEWTKKKKKEKKSWSALLAASPSVSTRSVEASCFSITKGGEERGRNRGRRRR